MNKYKKIIKEIKNKKNLIECLKWVLISIILISSIFIFYNQNIDTLKKTFFIILIIALASIVLSVTNKGRFIINFAKESRIEMYKIIWPSNKETFYTTLIVFLVTAITSLILWGLDSILIRIIAIITRLGS